MKITLFGASGHLGQGILNEALARGYDVTAVVRDATRLAQRNDKLKIVIGDVAQPASWLGAVNGTDAVVASLSGRRDGDHRGLPKHVSTLLDYLPQAGVTRLVWVGGAGSLEVTPGARVIDAPDFPAAWKPEAEAQGEALNLFRASQTDLDWTYVSPAALIEDGERTGSYRLGGEQLLVDSHGVSRISVADYAVAILDRIERRDALRQRVTVAY